MSQKKNKPNTNQHAHSAQTAPQNVRLVPNDKPAAPAIAPAKAPVAQAAATAQRAAESVGKATSQAAAETVKPFAKSSQNVASQHVGKSLEHSMDTLKDITENQQRRWEAVAESCKVATEVHQELNSNLQQDLNTLLQEQVELTKKFFGCRQVNDFVELQNQALRCHINHSIDLTARVAEAWFKLATDALEPIENARQTTRKLWKL